MLPPRRRISPGSPVSTSRPSPSTIRSSNPGRGRPTVVAMVSTSSLGRGGRRRAPLGQTVSGDDGGEGELGVEAADQLDRDVGGAGDGHPERRQVVDDRGRDGRACPGTAWAGPAAPSPASSATVASTRAVSNTASGIMVAPAADRGQDAGLQPEHVEVRIDHEVAVVGVQPGHGHPVGGHPHGARRGSGPHPWGPRWCPR